MKASFVLASTHIGTMIVNRHDRVVTEDAATGNISGYGVGFQLLERGAFDADELRYTLSLLELKRRYRGDGVVAADVGANIGAFTVPWAQHMEGWGSVFAFEAQERIFYALAGNIVLNNRTNARAFLGVVTDRDDDMSRVDQLDFDLPGSYGSLSLISKEKSADVGQDLTHLGSAHVVHTHSLEVFFSISRLDLVKIDVEGMEREHPILIVEHLKSDKAELHRWMEARGYSVIVDGLNYLGVHRDDPCLKHVRER